MLVLLLIGSWARFGEADPALETPEGYFHPKDNPEGKVGPIVLRFREDGEIRYMMVYPRASGDPDPVSRNAGGREYDKLDYYDYFNDEWLFRVSNMGYSWWGGYLPTPDRYSDKVFGDRTIISDLYVAAPRD